MSFFSHWFSRPTEPEKPSKLEIRVPSSAELEAIDEEDLIAKIRFCNPADEAGQAYYLEALSHHRPRAVKIAYQILKACTVPDPEPYVLKLRELTKSVPDLKIWYREINEYFRAAFELSCRARTFHQLVGYVDELARLVRPEGVQNKGLCELARAALGSTDTFIDLLPRALKVARFVPKAADNALLLITRLGFHQFEPFNREKLRTGLDLVYRDELRNLARTLASFPNPKIIFGDALPELALVVLQVRNEEFQSLFAEILAVARGEPVADG